MDAAQLIQQAAQHQRAGRINEAEKLLEKVVRNEPGNEVAVQGLVRIWVGTRRSERCFRLLERAIEAQPSNPHFHGDLGVLQQRAGKLLEAERSFGEAIRFKPNDPLPYLALGQLLADSRRIPEAEEQFRRALKIQPWLHVAWIALSVMALKQGRLVESVQHAQRAVRVGPKAPQTHHALGSALHALGHSQQAHASFVECMKVGGTPSAGSSLLHNLNFIADASPQQVFEAHCGWARRFADNAPARFVHRQDRLPDRRLRVGYISPDFREHAVMYFVEPLLGGHDRSSFEVFCYSTVSSPDAVTDRLKGCTDQWRDIANLSDDAAAELVHADSIDVLVDLAGHTDRHRLGIFARRAAPVQVSYQGYPNTTGMRAMGYRLTDSHADPPQTTDRFHTEKLIRLPQTAWLYAPPEPSPPVAELPALARGSMTFGSFNRLSKIGPLVVRLWSRAVNAVSGARLVLKTHGLQDPATANHVREAFAREGLCGDRLVLLGPEPSVQVHLERYGDIDIALDCYPYHGTTTSCEALWMGVPSITLVGDAHVSRVGASLLTNLGLPQFIAASSDQFVEIAQAVTSDLSELAELRRTLRSRMRLSPLMDVAGVVRAVEDAYRLMWREWCSGV